jgi:predicted  nucleic acid-binding Zn-ribbon protein
MQLHVARLCMDCDEVHDSQTCPVCGSESFAYITRWIPAPERRRRPRPPQPSDTAATYRELLSPEPQQSGMPRWLRRGAVGLAALTAFGWAWQRGTATTTKVGDAGNASERESPPSA